MLRCLASMSPKAHFRILGGYWTGHALWVTGPRARFSKVPIINGPGKLSPFTLKIEVSIVGFHMTSLKFRLKNYRSYREFTFTMH